MYVFGTDANNIFSGYNGNDTYYAKKGNDRIYDYRGNDIYQFYLGDGQDTITDSNGNDTISFGNGITADNLIFTRNGNNVLIGISGTTDVITIADWYVDPKYKIEKIKLNDGTVITSDDIEELINPPSSTITGEEGNDVLDGTTGKDTIYGLGGDDTIFGDNGNDFIMGDAGNDVIDGGMGADTMTGGSGNDTYYVDNSGDIVIEEQNVQPAVLETVSPPDASWITSSYLKDIYTRTYPRIAGNQWHVSPDGMFFAAATYTNSQLDLTASWLKDKELLNIAAEYLDFVTLNRAGTRSGVPTDYNDLFLDNYDSTHNPEMGLLKTRNDIYDYAADYNRRIYVLPYLNMSDVWDYQSITKFPNWNFWHKPDGQNIGSWDYMMNNNLALKSSSGEIIYYYSTDTHRPFGDSRQEQWQDYYVAHAVGIVEQGFDGIYSDNWWRSKSTGTLWKLTDAEFAAVQDGWNTIGEKLKEAIGNNILIGNSPAYSRFTSRDVCMLEDRIDDILGTADKSIASYFMYSEAARNMDQVCEDSYYDESKGPFETFRLPMNLMTDNIFAVGTTTNEGTHIENFFDPVELLGEIGYPLGDREIVSGTDTGIADVVSGYSVERCVYVRYFSEGLAYLNNSGSQQTVILPEGQWLRSDGQTFEGGDSITIDNVRGWVFKRTDTPIPPEDEGIDTIISTISYTLSSNVENLTLSGISNLIGFGNNLDNTIIGNSGNDTLSGEAGNDTLMGHTGNDTYLFNIGDGIDIVNDSGGNDTIIFDEESSRSNFGFMRDGNDIIFGILGHADTLTVKNWYTDNSSAKIENIKLGDGTTFTANQIEHIIDGTLIYGTAGDDTLTGDTAQSMLKGSTGNDIYIVNDPGVTIIENPNEGTDTVQTGTSYSLSANLENLVLTGSADISGTGNTLNNIITGNTGNDTLSGQAGNDTLIGNTANDTYIFAKGEGQDLIQDSGGSDILRFDQRISKRNLAFSKSGNDLIISISGSSDKITVYNWTDSQNKIEKLQFSDGTSMSSQDIENIINVPFSGIIPTAVGTDGNNIFRYRYGNDIYYGKKGNDLFYDPQGNDTYLFRKGDGQDRISDTNGTDRIVFDQGIYENDLVFSKVSGSHLSIAIKGTTDSITILNWTQSKYRIEKIQFSDGTFLTSTDVNNILQQLTAYSPDYTTELSNIDKVQPTEAVIVINSASF